MALVDVSPEQLEELQKQEQQAEADRAFAASESGTEGLVTIKPSSRNQQSRADKLREEMEHETFVPGISDEQLQGLKEEGPRAAGGIIGGIFGGPLTAGLGGYTGESLKDIYNYYYSPEDAPQTFREEIVSPFKGGGEEFFYDAAGKAILAAGGATYHVIRPKLKGGIIPLREQFRQYGGRFTEFQQTESDLIAQLDSLSRGSMTGKPVMRAADDVNDMALKAWRKDLSAQIATTARENMSASEFGDLMFNTLQGGKAGFKKYIGELYGSFDDLVKTQTREVLLSKPVPSSIVDEQGKAMLRQQTEQFVEELRPVDARPLKEAASNLFTRLEKSANLGKSDFGGVTIDKVLQLDDALSFSVAQDARSTLLELGRAAKEGGEDKLSGSINKFADEISKAMDDAARKQGTETLLKYKAIKREAEEGYSAFNDQFISRFLNDKISIEKFSDELFKPGNSAMIPKFRKALNVAAKNDPTIDKRVILDQVKQNYLEDILNQSGKSVEFRAGETVEQYQQRTGVPLSQDLRTFFGDDPRRATMDMLFSPREKEALHKFSQAVETVQEINPAGMSMVMQITQGGAAMQMAAGEPGALRRAGMLFLPTKYIAKAMTNPVWIDLMTSAAKTPRWAAEAPLIASKLAVMMANIEREESGQTRLGQDVANYLAQSGENNVDAAIKALGLKGVSDEIKGFLDSNKGEPIGAVGPNALLNTLSVGVPALVDTLTNED